MLKLLLFALYLGRGLCSEIPADSPVCDLQCRSVRFIDNFIEKLSDDSIEISDGVKFVRTDPGDVGAGGNGGRSVRDSLLTRFKRFLSSYELQVKIPDLLPRKQDVTSALHSAIGYLNELQSDGNNEGTARKGGGIGGGGKKGGGAILMMATMMGGTMAALGFGALGMLAMKALTVSAMALLLSAVIGLKKLMSKGDDDHHASISYVPVHHGGHRRRRDTHDLPYRAHVNRSIVG